jgi:hypothetical protein
MLSVNMPATFSVDSPSITVNPVSTVDPSLTVGMLYTVSINTDYTHFLNGITSYQFTLNYNPAVLEGYSTANGDLIVGGSAQFKSGKFNETSGQLSLTVGFFFDPESDMATGPGKLAEVTFRVVGAGSSSIMLGPETMLFGWNFFLGSEFVIVDAATMPTHIQGASFDNTGAVMNPPYAPVASIAGDGTGFTNETVSLSGAGSYDPDGTALVSYEWNLGDGTTATGVAVSHMYTTAGIYKVTLRVTDSQSQVSDKALQTILVEDRPPFKANLVDRKAWSDHKNHDISKHGDINVLTAKVINNGTESVFVKVVFTVYDARGGTMVDTLETAEVALPGFDATQLLTVDLDVTDPLYGTPKYVVFIVAQAWFGETAAERPGLKQKTIRLSVKP